MAKIKAKDPKAKVARKKKPKAKPKVKKISTAGLDKGQKTFINSKVKELGDVEAVSKFYHRDDTVSFYANQQAVKFYKGK